MAHDTMPHETVSFSVNENEHVVLFSAHRNEVDEPSLYIVPETLSAHIPSGRATLHDGSDAAVHSG
ncbi:hypothetical protein AB0E59_34100 [Lentzea sp. NPDC034063]|uniref:hypothetical protein n=1 Tax=unclassified Lentzea TaxID=2643253 RepID=UPI0033D4A8C4